MGSILCVESYGGGFVFDTSVWPSNSVNKDLCPYDTLSLSHWDATCIALPAKLEGCFNHWEAGLALGNRTGVIHAVACSSEMFLWAAFYV